MKTCLKIFTNQDTLYKAVAALNNNKDLVSLEVCDGERKGSGHYLTREGMSVVTATAHRVLEDAQSWCPVPGFSGDMTAAFVNPKLPGYYISETETGLGMGTQDAKVSHSHPETHR